MYWKFDDNLGCELEMDEDEVESYDYKTGVVVDPNLYDSEDDLRRAVSQAFWDLRSQDESENCGTVVNNEAYHKTVTAIRWLFDAGMAERVKLVPTAIDEEYFDGPKIIFENSSDAMMFKLAHGGQ